MFVFVSLTLILKYSIDFGSQYIVIKVPCMILL
jgi:hypothetical protein